MIWRAAAKPGVDGSDALRSAVRKARVNVILPVALGYLMILLDRASVVHAAGAVGPALNLSPVQIGLVTPVLFLAVLLFAVPEAVLAGRVGARRWLSGTLLLSGLATIGSALPTGPGGFFVARCVAGIAQAAFLPAAIFVTATWAPAVFRTRLVAWVVLISMAAAAAGQPLFAGLLALDGVGGVAGWRWLGLCLGLPCLPLAAFLVLRASDQPRDARWLTEDERSALAWSRSVEPRDTRNDTAFSALLDPRLLLLAVINFGLSLSAVAAGTWYAALVYEQRAPLALLSIGFILSTVATVLIWSRRVDRNGRVLEGLAIAAALATVAYAAGVFRGPMVTKLVGLAAHAATIEAARTMMWSVAGRLAVLGRGGIVAVAIIDVTGQVSTFVAPRIIGWSAERAANLQFGLLVLILVPLAVAGLAGLLRMLFQRG